MTLQELDRLAYEMQELPAGLNMPQTFYYLSMRSLYAVYHMKAITAEQAAKEKTKIVGDYNAFDLVYRIGEHDMRVLRKIQDSKDYYNKNGCPVCKQLANQICGLELELTCGDIVELGSDT